MAFAALRPGRRVAYWWSDAESWAAGVVSEVSDDVTIEFEADGSSKSVALYTGRAEQIQ